METPEGVTRRSMALYCYTASRAIHDEVPSMSILYKARPNDSAEVKREALGFQADQYFRQWAPPVVVRGVHKIPRGIRKLRG